jgi:hypothetical protein
MGTQLFRADGRTDEQKDRDSRRTDRVAVTSGTTEALLIAGTKFDNGVASLTYRLAPCGFRQDVNSPYIIHPIFV